MNKRGQAAMEFLMTYGWAIVVVLAAIGALAYFGVLSPQKLLPDRTTFSAPLPNVDNALIVQNAANTEVEVAFRNNKGVPVKVLGTTTLTSTQCGAGSIVSVTDSLNNSITYAPTDNIQNGVGFLVRWSCPTTGTQATGNKFKADISFDYQNSETGQTLSQTGSVEGKYS